MSIGSPFDIHFDLRGGLQGAFGPLGYTDNARPSPTGKHNVPSCPMSAGEMDRSARLTMDHSWVNGTLPHGDVQPNHDWCNVSLPKTLPPVDTNGWPGPFSLHGTTPPPGFSVFDGAPGNSCDNRSSLAPPHPSQFGPTEMTWHHAPPPAHTSGWNLHTDTETKSRPYTENILPPPGFDPVVDTICALIERHLERHNTEMRMMFVHQTELNRKAIENLSGIIKVLDSPLTTNPTKNTTTLTPQDDPTASDDETPHNAPSGDPPSVMCDIADVIHDAVTSPSDLFAHIISVLYWHGVNTLDGIVMLRPMYVYGSMHIIVSVPTVVYVLRTLGVDMDPKVTCRTLKRIGIKLTGPVEPEGAADVDNLEQYFGLRHVNCSDPFQSRFIVIPTSRFFYAALAIRRQKLFVKRIVDRVIPTQALPAMRKYRSPFRRSLMSKCREFYTGWSMVDDARDLRELWGYIRQCHTFGIAHGLYAPQEHTRIQAYSADDCENGYMLTDKDTVPSNSAERQYVRQLVTYTGRPRRSQSNKID